MLMVSLAATGLPPLPEALFFSIFTGIFAVFSAQWVATGSFSGALRWVRHQFPAFVASIPAAAAIPLLIAALTNRFWPGFSLGYFLCYVVAKADQVKYETALTHFLWSDLFKTSDPGKFRELISHYIRPAFFLPMLLGQLLGNGLLYAGFGRGFLAGPGDAEGRLLAALAGLGLLGLYWNYGHLATRARVQKWLHLPVLSSADYDQNVRWHGSWLAFFAHIQLVAIDQDQPACYTSEQARTIQSLLDSYAGPAAQTPAMEKPTMIVLAVEALWDIARIRGLEFADDPLQAFRADYAGDVTASCFAGLTANSEFEFLTGLSIRALHDSACPFIKITHPLPALPAHLRQQGYRTSAIHSYTRTFYDRDKVYAHLGFDRFDGLEELTAQGYARSKGWYMADEALVEPILAQLQQTAGPQLIYALTMQNHGPYAPDRYTAQELEVAASPRFLAGLDMTAGDRRAVINYTQGLLDAGRLYGKIRQQIEQLDRPVLLLAFGDHLPGIGEHSGYRLMLQSGMATSVKDPALYQVPVFYHANAAARDRGYAKSLELRQDNSGHWPDFAVLGARLVQASGLPLPPLQQMVLDLHQSAPPMKKASGESREDLRKAYEWIQYDWLWGKGYTLPR